jgi:hypothetical protein
MVVRLPLTEDGRCGREGRGRVYPFWASIRRNRVPILCIELHLVLVARVMFRWTHGGAAMSDTPSAERETRREVMKKAAYVVPAVVTLKIAPAFAQRGSGPPVKDKDKDKIKIK